MEKPISILRSGCTAYYTLIIPGVKNPGLFTFNHLVVLGPGNYQIQLIV